MSQTKAIKSYVLPIEVPRDLIDVYIETKEKALELVMAHIFYSPRRKARLRLKAEESRRIRNKLLEDWPYASHYVDSTINLIISLVKGWITLHNRGKAKKKPEITKKTVYINNTLFRVRGSELIIRIIAGKRYLEVDLSKFDYLPEDYDSIGGLLLMDDERIITFKRSPKAVKPKGWSAFNVNETNVTEARDGFGLIRHYLRQLYRVHSPMRRSAAEFRPSGSSTQGALGGSWRSTQEGNATEPKIFSTSSPPK